MAVFITLIFHASKRELEAKLLQPSFEPYLTDTVDGHVSMALTPYPLPTPLPHTRLPSGERINFELFSLAVLALYNRIPEYFQTYFSLSLIKFQ